MDSNLIAGIIGLVVGVLFYVTDLKGKLKKSEQDKSRLETEKAMDQSVFDFRKAEEKGKDSEENYKNIRDKYLDGDDDGDGAA